MVERSQVINFGAGPSALPDAVLAEAARGLLNYDGTGIGITELSHRSPQFRALAARLESLIRAQLGVPAASHAVLFTQGGGSAQFSAVVLNLLARHRLLHPEEDDDEDSAFVANYVVTGSWSRKALAEAQRLLGGATHTHVVVDARAHSADGASFDRVPPHAAFAFSPRPAYVYYCENETVDGVQFAADPADPASFPFARIPRLAPGGDKDEDDADFAASRPPLVADVSSSFLSRRIPRLEQHALLFAGAQKNLGPAGLTVLIVRRDLLVDTDAAASLHRSSRVPSIPVPLTLAYKTLADAQSLYNTPATFAVYVSRLVLEAAPPMPQQEAATQRKAAALYNTLELAAAAGKVRIRVQPGSRSSMNVTFEVLGDGQEALFLSSAQARGFLNIKGHRSVGGIRVSLYNAITEEQVARLVAYIDEFFGEKK